MSKIKVKAIKGLEELINGQLESMKNDLKELTKKHDSLEENVEKIALFAKDDFKDTFIVGDETPQTDFVLTHKPIGTIKLFVDGVRYFDDCFTYNADTKTLTWTGTDATLGAGNGFDLQDNTVVVEYDYDEKAEAAASQPQQ